MQWKTHILNIFVELYITIKITVYMNLQTKKQQEHYQDLHSLI